MEKEKKTAKKLPGSTRSYTLYREDDIENVDKIYRYLASHKLVISRINKLSPVQFALKKCVEILDL